LDQRLKVLKQWLDDTLDVNEYEVQPASEDASFRRYFRVFAAGKSYIAMDAPPDKENTEPFIRIGKRLFALGLNVPEILYQDVESGFLLLDDLGDRTYLNELNQNKSNREIVERLYGDAMGALVVLQAGTFSEPGFLPDYDAALLMQEMNLFPEWYLGKHLGINLNDEQLQIIEKCFQVLAEMALMQPRVWVHRDYHSRNLMLTSRNNPGILDFQDAVTGPVTYDLVSLLRDCYIAWPREQVTDWAKGYFQLAQESGLPMPENKEEFLRWFDYMGVQRHLKAIGIFSRLCHRDGKNGFLNDIPRTLAYVKEVCHQYPDLKPFTSLLQNQERNSC
jgi:N-acetylmuramate 1-kinase